MGRHIWADAVAPAQWDGDVVTLTWATAPGAEILSADVVSLDGSSMLTLRVRVPDLNALPSATVIEDS